MPSRSWCLASAPLSSSTCTHWRWPSTMASLNGVRPCESCCSRLCWGKRVSEQGGGGEAERGRGRGQRPRVLPSRQRRTEQVGGGREREGWGRHWRDLRREAEEVGRTSSQNTHTHTQRARTATHAHTLTHTYAHTYTHTYTPARRRFLSRARQRRCATPAHARAALRHPSTPLPLRPPRRRREGPWRQPGAAALSSGEEKGRDSDREDGGRKAKEERN